MAVSTKPKTKVASSAASNPLGKPSTPSQPSRKTKSSWRKNIHLPALIDTPPSTLPPPSHTLTNAQLYTEDRSADRVGANVVLGLVPQRKRKGAGLKSLEVLKNRSDVPAIPGRPRPSRNGGVSKEVKDQLRRIAHRDAEMVGSGTTGVKEAVVEAEFNIWEGNGGREEAGDGEAEGEGVEEEWIEDPRRVQAKLPRTMTSTPHPTDPIHLARTLTPALPIPHPGTSYNPTAADHAELLRLAYDSEIKKERAEREGRAFKAYLEKGRKEARERAWEGGEYGDGDEKRKGRKGKGKGKGKKGEEGEGGKRSVAERVNDTLVHMAGMDPLPPAEDEEEVEGERVEDGEESEEEEEQVYEIKRKTKQQRARAQRVKEEAAAAAAAKQARIHKALLYTLPSLRRRANAAHKARLEAAASLRLKREERIRANGLEGVRVGRNRVGEVRSRMEVQLEEDLAEGLRGVKVLSPP
ncbi:unnamed protein product, partial [Tilletia controversa]